MKAPGRSRATPAVYGHLELKLNRAQARFTAPAAHFRPVRLVPNNSICEYQHHQDLSIENDYNTRVIT